LHNCTVNTTISCEGNKTASMYNRTSGYTGSVSCVLASSSSRWSAACNSLPR